MPITTQGLLAMSMRPLIIAVRKFFIRRQIAFLEQEKQIIIGKRKLDYWREKELDKAQMILRADLNLLVREEAD